MKRLLYAAVLAVVVGGIFAPAALAQNVLDCKNFPSQAAAQQNLRENPSDPNRLDTNNNGIACEDYPYPAGTPKDLTPVGQQPAPQQPATPQPTPEQTATPQPTPKPTPAPKAEATGQLMEAGGNLPATGGPALLLPTAALLVGSGLLVVAVRRRG